MNSSEKDYEALVGLYKDWNSRINVISRKDIDNIYSHHILHSLAIAEYMRSFYPEGVWDGASVLDLGTGGGFPGIPLAMNYPAAHFVLCDSVGKKITVASAVSEAMGLDNVECVNARAESLGRTFDWVVSRAVTTLENFYPWVKGRFNRSILYLKGGDVEKEMQELSRKYHIESGKMRAWSIKEWLDDDYFAEKFVIEIGKDYLCPPVFE